MNASDEELELASLSEEYLERADDFRQQAQRSALPRVRERCLRSAEAWESMARRRAEHEALKTKNTAAAATQV